jgi:DNA-binding response OmpR family regulator
VRLLIVEDEATLARALERGLAEEGYEVDVAATGEEGFALAGSRTYDLVLLDVMLPGRSGFELLETLRANRNTTPVICVTARDGVPDRVRGLDLGADDYLVKPFAFPELLARIRALIRRRQAGADPLVLRCADVELDLVSRKLRRAGREIELTARELAFLEYLLRNQRRPLSREELMREVWKEERPKDLMTNVVDVYVRTLREKLRDDATSPRALIRTLRGVGYEMRAPS